MRRSVKISPGNAPPCWSPPNAATCNNEFIEITEDEANQIVERIRAEVTGSNST